MARAETGSFPGWDTVLALLAAAGRGLALSLPEHPPEQHLIRWLEASTSQRLHWSLGARQNMLTDNDHPVWMALRRAAALRVVVLDPVASIGVWLPDVPAPVPLPVTVVGRVLHEPELAVRHGPVSIEGLVPVGVSDWREVLAYPPDHPLMAVDPVLASRLRGVAALLDERQRRDALQRRPPPHKNSNVRWEHAVAGGRRPWRTISGRLPDPRSRREWRLGGETSFREWLALRGYPVWDLPSQQDEE